MRMERIGGVEAGGQVSTSMWAGWGRLGFLSPSVAKRTIASPSAKGTPTSASSAAKSLVTALLNALRLYQLRGPAMSGEAIARRSSVTISHEKNQRLDLDSRLKCAPKMGWSIAAFSPWPWQRKGIVTPCVRRRRAGSEPLASFMPTTGSTASRGSSCFLRPAQPFSFSSAARSSSSASSDLITT